MKCPKCNAENNDGAKFCNDCGENLQLQENMSSSTENIVLSSNTTVKKPKKKINKKILIAIVGVILLLIIFSSDSCAHVYTDATCDKAMVCELCGKENGQPLGHEWLDATCTEAKKCNRCELVDGEELGHEWVDATCTEAKKCNRCAETKGKPLGHKSEKWTITKKATCSKTGTETGTCIRCEEQVTREIKKTKHNTGDWEITKKATVGVKGKRQKKCSVCNEIVAEEEYSLSKAEFKAQCKTYSYNTIARNPEKYKGEYGKFYGKIIQVMESNTYGIISYTLRIALNGNYDNVILVTYYAISGEDHLLEDDYVTLYGEIQGTKTYETVMGAEVTIPFVTAEYIDIH